MSFITWISKLLGRPVSGPASVSRASNVALIRTASELKHAQENGYAGDLKALADCEIEGVNAATRKQRAEASIAEDKARVSKANADKLVAEAEAEADLITLRMRVEQVKLIEAEQKVLDEARSRTERAQRQRELEAKRHQAIEGAIEAFSEKVRALRAKGGDIHFDPENLRKILESQIGMPALPPPEDITEPPAVETRKRRGKKPSP